MPLEAKMVTKAIERAQNTVEARNFEIRKDVLKYDEVMNEQRKIIYRRRQQILDGEDLGEQTVVAISDVVERLVETYCVGEFSEEWDLDELHKDLQLSVPSTLAQSDLNDVVHIEQLKELVIEDALNQYRQKEDQVGSQTLREIERRVMLSVIDQHWLEHLYEMDYLREGINLRAMGQQDPLAEWQREGFDMFEAMMSMIDDDFVRYVTHLDVAVDEATSPVRDLNYSAPGSPVQGTSAMEALANTSRPDVPGAPPEEGNGLEYEAVSGTVRVEKTPGRNDPCFCGSGKKFKLCHGR
jgi:preprotein translocase subunit SecA